MAYWNGIPCREAGDFNVSVSALQKVRAGEKELEPVIDDVLIIHECPSCVGKLGRRIHLALVDLTIHGQHEHVDGFSHPLLVIPVDHHCIEHDGDKEADDSICRPDIDGSARGEPEHVCQRIVVTAAGNHRQREHFRKDTQNAACVPAQTDMKGHPVHGRHISLVFPRAEPEQNRHHLKYECRSGHLN